MHLPRSPQVRNLRSCISVSAGFVAPEHVSTCLRLTGCCPQVPISDVVSEPLLLASAPPGTDGDSWREARPKACHLPPESARACDWYQFGDTRAGHAIIFPGDGGDGDFGIFHGSAWLSEEGPTRRSFDAREFVWPRLPGDEQAAAEAEARLERERAEWEAELEGLDT